MNQTCEIKCPFGLIRDNLLIGSVWIDQKCNGKQNCAILDSTKANANLLLVIRLYKFIM